MAEEKRRKKGLARCNNALIEKQPVFPVQPRLPPDPQMIATSNHFAMTSLPSNAFTEMHEGGTSRALRNELQRVRSVSRSHTRRQEQGHSNDVLYRVQAQEQALRVLEEALRSAPQKRGQILL